MGVDVAGDGGQPFAVERAHPRRRGIAGRRRHDSPASNHDRPLLDHLAGPDDDADVVDGEILRGETGRARKSDRDNQRKKALKCVHGPEVYRSPRTTAL